MARAAIGTRSGVHWPSIADAQRRLVCSRVQRHNANAFDQCTIQTHSGAGTCCRRDVSRLLLAYRVMCPSPSAPVAQRFRRVSRRTRHVRFDFHATLADQPYAAASNALCTIERQSLKFSSLIRRTEKQSLTVSQRSHPPTASLHESASCCNVVHHNSADFSAGRRDGSRHFGYFFATCSFAETCRDQAADTTTHCTNCRA